MRCDADEASLMFRFILVLGLVLGLSGDRRSGSIESPSIGFELLYDALLQKIYETKQGLDTRVE